MVRVAILGSQLLGQLENEELSPGVEVVWKGASAEEFRREVPALKPDVVVVDLVELSGAVDQEVRSLFGLTEYELGIVTYSFARRQLLRELKDARVRVLQTPVHLDTLRAHLMPLVMKSALGAGGRAAGEAPAAPARQPPAAPPAPATRPGDFRYSRQQLGRLLTIKSSVACECPNHVAQLVESLQQFELYSRDCANRDDEDKAMHAQLAHVTGQARTLMEDVLADLIKHERITV